MAPSAVCVTTTAAAGGGGGGVVVVGVVVVAVAVVVIIGQFARFLISNAVFWREFFFNTKIQVQKYHNLQLQFAK